LTIPQPPHFLINNERLIAVGDVFVIVRSLSPPYFVEGRVVSYKERKITILLEGDRKLTDNLEV
jgi:hypothetical protein